MSSAYYKSIRNDRERELRNYESRKKALEGILNSYRTFEVDASALNTYYRNAANGMQYGIKVSGGSIDSWGLWGTPDGGSNDQKLSNSRSQVMAELGRVNARIQELNDEISRLRIRIQQEEQWEREEARRAREAEQRAREERQRAKEATR